LSRVVVDLLGPVPVTDRIWVRAHVEHPGTKVGFTQLSGAPGTAAATILTT
jgi:hypothetical protein